MLTARPSVAREEQRRKDEAARYEYQPARPSFTTVNCFPQYDREEQEKREKEARYECKSTGRIINMNADCYLNLNREEQERKEKGLLYLSPVEFLFMIHLSSSTIDRLVNADSAQCKARGSLEPMASYRNVRLDFRR